MIKGKILLVDDELSICRLVARILEEDNYLCRFAQSGKEALSCLSKEPFDLMMTDVMMPGMDGVELTEAVAETYPDLGVLLMTGVDDLQTAMKAIELGAYGYLQKPCSDFQIIIHVANAMRRGELEKLARSYRQSLESEVLLRTEELESMNDELQSSVRNLQQQDKLASIGVLAAGVAHEIKTPAAYIATNLGSLRSYVERMLTHIDKQQEIIDKTAADQQKEELTAIARGSKLDTIKDDAVDLIDDCMDGIDRVKEIVKGLREFSCNADSSFAQLDINDVIEDSLRLVRSELIYLDEVHFLRQPLPCILGNRQRLGQVVVNLLLNAKQAIVSQGVIRIETRIEGDVIDVRFIDNGCGIAAATIEKIFDPFFTTKDIEHGTGLGLSIVKGIIDDHGGSLEVESQPGCGATMIVRLPIIPIEG